MDFVLGVPLKVIAATFALNLAAEKAVEVRPMTWCLKSRHLAKVTGLDGLSSFLGCFGLGLAFLSIACGIACGSVIMVASKMRPQSPWLTTACIGLSVCGGCGLAGGIIGTVSITLMTLAQKGLLVTGFILGLGLLIVCRETNNLRMTPSRMLVMFSVTFMTVHLSVYSGHNSNIIVVLTVLPALVLMGYLADKIAFKKATGYIILTFILLVPFTGILIGIGTERYSLKHSHFRETVETVKFLVYGVQMMTGLIGAVIGALTINSWQEEEAVRGLSLWICGPATVILYNLDICSPDPDLHSFFRDYFGAGAELGLISGLAGASGVSLGLAVRRTQKACPATIVLMVGFLSVVALKYFLPCNNIIVPVICPLALWVLSNMEDIQVHEHRHKVGFLLETAVDTAVLGGIMMGAMVVGVAGLLTAALGSAGSYGIMFGLIVAIWNALKVSCESS